MAGFIVTSMTIPGYPHGAESASERSCSAVGLNPEDTFLIASGIKYVNIGLPGNIVRGMLSKPEQIELDIAELDFQRLAYERESALRQGYWIPSDEDYVPVTIRYKNQTLHGKARLKGDNSDHYYGEKWSLRFELNGDDRLDHMGEFGLASPPARASTWPNGSISRRLPARESRGSRTGSWTSRSTGSRWGRTRSSRSSTTGSRGTTGNPPGRSSGSRRPITTGPSWPETGCRTRTGRCSWTSWAGTQRRRATPRPRPLPPSVSSSSGATVRSRPATPSTSTGPRATSRSRTSSATSTATSSTTSASTTTRSAPALSLWATMRTRVW